MPLRSRFSDIGEVLSSIQVSISRTQRKRILSSRPTPYSAASLFPTRPLHHLPRSLCTFSSSELLCSYWTSTYTVFGPSIWALHSDHSRYLIPVTGRGSDARFYVVQGESAMRSSIQRMRLQNPRNSLVSVLQGILIVYGMLSRGGLKAVESLLAMVGLLEDEKEFLLPSHSYPHDGMGTDSIASNPGFAQSCFHIADPTEHAVGTDGTPQLFPEHQQFIVLL